VSSVEIPATTKQNSIECEVPDWRQVLSPVKVVVGKIEDFILPNIPGKLNENMSNFCKEENSFVGKVITGKKVVPRRRTRYSAVNKARPVLGVVPRKLRSSISKQMPLGSCVEVKTNRRVNKKSQISDQPKELGDRTCVEVSDVAVLSQKTYN
jgi:hypothetical protein